MEHRGQWQRDSSSSPYSDSLKLGDPRQGSEATDPIPKLEIVKGTDQQDVERNDSYSSYLVPGSTWGAHRKGSCVGDRFAYVSVLPLVDSGVILKKPMLNIKSGIFLLRCYFLGL